MICIEVVVVIYTSGVVVFLFLSVGMMRNRDCGVSDSTTSADSTENKPTCTFKDKRS